MVKHKAQKLVGIYANKSNRFQELICDKEEYGGNNDFKKRYFNNNIKSNQLNEFMKKLQKM